MNDIVHLRDDGEPTVTEAVAAFRTAGFRNDLGAALLKGEMRLGG